ncbi:MAG: retention module-containing protein, partial [Dechloromonas sp.]
MVEEGWASYTGNIANSLWSTVMAQAPIIAKVTSLSGEAYARNAEGRLRRLKAGDEIREGESVVTADGAQVVLQLADGRQLTVLPGDVVRIDAEVAAEFKPDASDSVVANDPKAFRKISEALARGEDLDALLEDPAAGNAGPGSEGHTFVEFARIVETLDPLSYQFGTERNPGQETFDGGAANAEGDAADDGSEDNGNAVVANTPPDATNDSQPVTEDSPVTGNVLSNDSDPDGNPLTVTQYEVGGTTYVAGTPVVLPGVGTLVIESNGDYSFTPAANYTGAIPVATYTISDGLGGTDTATLTLGPITLVDDPSVLAPDSQTVAEDNPAIGNVLSNDADVDNALTVTSFTINGTTYAAGATATLAGVGILVIETNGDYTFTPEANWNGTVPQATYTTNTGSTSTLDITVTPVDDASILAPDSQTVAEDNPAVGNVLSNDADVDNALTVTSFTINGTTYAAGATATLAGIGTLVIEANGDYTFTPETNWNGSVPQATYTTNTGSTSTLDITVTPVDDASILAPDSQTVAEDNPAIGNVLSNDADVDNALTVTSFT